jgi:hypothetical protein
MYWNQFTTVNEVFKSITAYIIVLVEKQLKTVEKTTAFLKTVKQIVDN